MKIMKNKSFKKVVVFALTLTALCTLFYKRNIGAYEARLDEVYTQDFVNTLQADTDKKDLDDSKEQKDSKEQVKAKKEITKVERKDETIVVGAQSNDSKKEKTGEVNVDTTTSKNIKQESSTEATLPKTGKQEEIVNNNESNVVTPKGNDSQGSNNQSTPSQNTFSPVDSSSQDKEAEDAKKAAQAIQAEQRAREEAIQKEAENKARLEAEAKAKADAEKAAQEAAKPKFAPNSIYINGTKVGGTRSGNVFSNVDPAVFTAGKVMITDGNGNGQTVTIGSSFDVTNDNIQLPSGEDVSSILNGSYGVVFVRQLNSYAKHAAQGM